LSNNQLTAYINGTNREFIKSKIVPRVASPVLDSLEFAAPVLNQNLRSLRGPEYPLLSLAQIKASKTTSQVVVSNDDPIGDDVGTGAFDYPTGSPFVKGSFDLTRFTVRVDRSNAYFELKFRALSNPGWHPEYGFQLTYAAIAIDEDGIENSGKPAVGHNANFVLQGTTAYEKLILIGGGVRLEDMNGKILCAYIPTPEDISNPLGDTKNASIRFAIPLSYLGAPTEKWTWTVLVGAQDDHGGAGLGEFRTVNARAGEWNGGGRISPNDPNVYDILTVSER
jgi:carbohydrate-binding DOMON domain-containing protein